MPTRDSKSIPCVVRKHGPKADMAKNGQYTEDKLNYKNYKNTIIARYFNYKNHMKNHLP